MPHTSPCGVIVVIAALLYSVKWVQMKRREQEAAIVAQKEAARREYDLRFKCNFGEVYQGIAAKID